MAPETTQGYPSTTKVDMWALGIILYQLISSRLPFDSQNNLEFQRFIREKEPSPLPETVSPFIKQIISRLLEKNPENRIDADELVKLPEIEKYIQSMILKISKVDNDMAI